MHTICKSNRLINEKSPYLLQHAHNPVDWFSWSKEAFDKARREDKPIFLSIGYSTCHWCHVMERESFEDEEVAEVLNKYFVSIKVDREERTDIDSIYMTFCQAFTGRGGWPLTVILTPDKKPFFAGTYFQKESLIELLNKVNDLWQKDKESLIKDSEDVVNEIKRYEKVKGGAKLDESIIKETAAALKSSFQRNYGGFSRAPKFPTPHNLYFLLRYYYVYKDEEALDIVEKNLMYMYKGGIFDHIGFGFSRYSTDEKWLVPHFEKMMYDNALLSLVYTEAYCLTKKAIYKEVAEKIYSYILRDMTSPEGGFYSAEDADSEGVEGKFYLWELDEIETVLGKEKSGIFTDIYDITNKGNFEGVNIPNLIRTSLDKIENNEGLKKELEVMREKLFQYREGRVHPFKDDKILTSWNGLTIASLSYAGKVLNNNDYIKASKKAADFIIENLIREDGRLLARYRDGEAANLAVLEDYAFFVFGLIELYQASFEVKYLDKALELNNQMIELFMDEEGGFYLYGKDGEELIMRPKEIYDGAIPSGNSVAAQNLIRLRDLSGNFEFDEIKEKQINAFSSKIKRSPTAYVNLITAFMYSFAPIREIVIAGKKDEKFVQDALDIINKNYNPFQNIILNNESEELFKINKFIENHGKVNGKNLIYICENFSCTEPVDNLEYLYKRFER